MWNAGVWRAMVALLDGRLDDAETLAADAAAAGVRTESVTAPQYYSIQMLGVRREQDRMGELEPVLRQAVADNPGRPAWRAGLTTLLCVCGDENEARAQLRQLAAGRFDWTRDGDWIVAAVLAASAAADLGEREHAAALYELLVPYAASHAVVGIGATCLGSTSRPLGRLALVLGRRDAGIGHLRSALAANAALGAAVELAHTQVDLAAALGAGDEATNLLHDAQAAAGRMGWPWVGRRAERVRHR